MSESYFNINKYIINFINNFENQDEIHKEKFISFLIKQSFDEKLDYMYVKRCRQILPKYSDVEKIFEIEKYRVKKEAPKTYNHWWWFYEIVKGHVKKHFIPKNPDKLEKLIEEYIKNNRNSDEDKQQEFYY